MKLLRKLFIILLLFFPLLTQDLTIPPIIDIPTTDIPITTTPNPIHCSCIQYVISLGYSVTVNGETVDAIDLVPNSLPRIGGLVIFKYGEDTGHVAVIKQIQDNSIFIEEANYIPCEVSQRWIDMDDTSIIGYIFF